MKLEQYSHEHYSRYYCYRGGWFSVSIRREVDETRLSVGELVEAHMASDVNAFDVQIGTLINRIKELASEAGTL